LFLSFTDIDGEVSELGDIEEMTLELVREGEQDRLGCQTRILGDVSLTLPPQDS
jgi:ferredoxin